MSRTIEQRRAAFALGFIKPYALRLQEISQKDLDKLTKEEKKAKDLCSKLSTHIHKTPSLILQCGLGQALAFLLADAGSSDQDKSEGKAKESPSKLLYENALQTWLCGQRDEIHPMRVYPEGNLMEALLNGSRHDYFRAQEESLLLLDWLKKFAAAKL